MGRFVPFFVLSPHTCGAFFELVLRLEGFGARHFLVGVVRVACRFHPCRQEEAAFLGLGIVREGFVALFGEALFALGIYVAIIAGFVFTVGEEAAISRVGLDIPAHLAASVKGAKAAARNHDVELTTLHVVADVGGHHHKRLALELLMVFLGFVLAGTREGEGKALAAGVVVTGGCSECVGEFVTYDDGHLASASGALAAGANAAAVVADRSLALGIACFGRATMFRPCAVRHAAVPVTGCKALLATGTGVEILGFFGGGVSICLRTGRLDAARRSYARAGGFNAARRLGLLLLLGRRRFFVV